jgi:hypothetical protein
LKIFITKYKYYYFLNAANSFISHILTTEKFQAQKSCTEAEAMNSHIPITWAGVAIGVKFSPLCGLPTRVETESGGLFGQIVRNLACRYVIFEILLPFNSSLCVLFNGLLEYEKT